MRLIHFAYVLTALLIGATTYLAWEGQQAARGAKEELEFIKKKQAAEENASPAQDSLVSLPGIPAPATSITPPTPGTLAPTSPATASTPGTATSPASAPILSSPVTSELPGGGLTVPKTVLAAESKGINTNTLTPLQKQVLAASPVAKIKTIVKDQGFVILDAGSKQGFKSGQQLEVRRGNGVLGKIRLTDTIEENEAVADLDLTSIPAGVSIEPGDEVIQPVVR